MSATINELSKLDVWLLARCMVGYQPDAAHLRDATPSVSKLLRYLDGINFRDREIIARQSIVEAEFRKVVSCEPESKCPVSPDDGHNWTIIHASELKNLPPVEWLVRGEIPRGGLVVLFGMSGSGKSFLSLDYALNLAQDHPVVYIAAEGEWGYQQRVAAWCKHNSKSEGGLYICLGAVNLYNHVDFDAFVTRIGGIQQALVVVDTLAMCMTGANENDTRDMGLVVNACKQIQRSLNCAVMIVHHVNKGGVAERGSGVLRGASDIMIKVSALDDVIEVKSSKTKDLQPFPSRWVKLLPVAVGVDDEGNEIASAVCVPAEKMVRSAEDALSNTQHKILEILDMEVNSTGVSFREMEQITGLTIGSVQKAYNTLAKSGLVQKGESGSYAITDSGRRKLRGTESAESAESLNQSKNNPKLQKSQDSLDSVDSVDSPQPALFDLPAPAVGANYYQRGG